MEQFGKYELIRRIGSGGMAEVFLARTTVAQGLAKQLVIKKIRPAFARSRQFVSMFVDEAKIALGLNHPNIVQVFDFGTVDDTFFLAMEHIEGIDLLRLLQKLGRKDANLPHGLAAYIVQQVAKGLDYAHRKTDEFGEPLGIVHRDISPQNVLVSWDGAVKIVDFGIARARHIHEEEGIVKGKFAYMSPEQARGEVVDHRSDVYSAGIVLFELACGRQLFPGRGKEALEQVKTGAVPRPRDIDAAIPTVLEQTILRALTFHRDDRFQTARDLQNALGRFQFQHAKDADGPIDSASLAQFLARVAPDGRRSPLALPPGIDGATADTPAPGEPVTGSGVELHSIPSGATPAGGSIPATSPRHAARAVRERKYIFVVEGHICGLPSLEARVGRDAASRMVSDFFQIARDVAFKHQAHVHQIDLEALTLVVGLPVASEDDPSRALRLALALVDALDGIGHGVEPDLRLGVGIQRGTANLHRQPGARFTYELADSTTAIARRLAREAQGAELLVGGAVYRVARGDWNFEELSSIALDTGTRPGTGRMDDGATGTTAQRARVYRLVGPKERRQRLRDRSRDDADLVGRDLELKALRDAYRDTLVSRRKRHVLVIGDDGVGKRSLVRAFLDTIPTGEATVLHTAARVSTSYTPYGIIADLGRDLLGLAEGAEPKEIRRRIERMTRLFYPDEQDAREKETMTQVASLFLGARTEERDDMDPDERRQKVIQCMLRVEERFSIDKPLILVGEDVHWADTESMDIFVELLKVPTHRPLLGVVTARPEPRVLERLGGIDADIIRLEELGEADRLALITRRFVPDEDVAALAGQITGRAGGNPFFIREIVDALVERGILVREPADSEHAGLLRWVVRDASIQVPTSVEALLATRIDRLPAPEKEVILRASVLGRAFTPAAVRAVIDRPVADDIARLVDRGLLRRNGGGLAFRNDMAMTVAYRLLPDDTRGGIHRRAARQLAESPGYRSGQDDAVIARHLELGGDAAAAAERYLKAAAHAIEVGGTVDALRQLSRALKLLPASDHERRFAAHRQREDILGRLARRPQQLREIHNLQREADKIGTPDKMAFAHARLAQFYIDVGKLTAASRAVAAALQYARDAGDTVTEAEATRLRAHIARAHGTNEEALNLCAQAMRLCGDDRDGVLQRARILNVRGTTLWNMGRLEQAIEAYAESLVIYRMLKLPRHETQALNNMGLVFATLGEFEEALAHYKSSLKIDQKLGNRFAIALKLGNIGQAYSDLGDLDNAERYLKKAQKIAEQTEDDSSIADVAVTLGQVYLQREEFARAIERIDRGLALARETRDRYQEVRALNYLALAKLGGDHAAAEALVHARQATELARKMRMPIGEVYGLAIQGLALARLGRAGEGATLSGEALAVLSRNPYPAGREQVLHFHAVVCEQAGLLDDARSALERAQREVKAKAGRLRDRRLRDAYLGSQVSSAIADACARLLAS